MPRARSPGCARRWGTPWAEPKTTAATRAGRGARAWCAPLRNSAQNFGCIWGCTPPRCAPRPPAHGGIPRGHGGHRLVNLKGVESVGILSGVVYITMGGAVPADGRECNRVRKFSKSACEHVYTTRFTHYLRYEASWAHLGVGGVFPHSPCSRAAPARDMSQLPPPQSLYQTPLCPTSTTFYTTLPTEEGGR